MSLRSLQNEIISSILYTSAIVRQQGTRLIAPIAVDAVFFFLLGFVQSGLIAKIVEYLSASGVDMIHNLGFQSEYFPLLVMLIVAAIIILFLLYTIFQGTAWWLCRQLVKRENYSSYMIAFTLTSLVWGINYTIYSLAGLLVSIRETITKQAQTTANTFLFIYLLVIIFFAGISYIKTEKSFKKTMRGTFSKRNIIGIIPHYALIAAAFLLISLVLGRASGATTFIIQLVIVLPLLTLSRLYLASALRDN
ncbi:MAG: hypothetical protein V1837_00315 [Candidatus Woesearchaeota archaeon]